MPVSPDTSAPLLNTSAYSVANAERFGWSSISGDLNPERVQHLETHLTGQTILDAGCGGGAFVDFLSRQGFDVTGVDLYAEFLNVGREREYQGRFVQGDVTALPFADKEFDFTFCFDVLEHVDDEAALREFARVTRTRLLLAVPRENQEFQSYNLTFLPYQDTTHLRYYSEEALRRLAATIGAKSIQIVPELFVPVGRFVHDFTNLNRAALRERIAGLIADALADPPDDSQARQILVDQASPPDFPKQGVRSRLRAQAVADPVVQQHFQDAYRSVVSAAVEQRNAQVAARLDRATDVLVDQIVGSILFEATYAAVPSGLVAVIDL